MNLRLILLISMLASLAFVLVRYEAHGADPRVDRASGPIDPGLVARLQRPQGMGHGVPASTSVAPNNALALATELGARVGDCVAHPMADVSCADADHDGLTDAWEQLVLERLTPMVRFNDQERLLHDPGAAVAAIGRVAPARRGDHVRVMIVLAYERDYGRCGRDAHAGDSERVALDLRLTPERGAGGAEVIAVYTAAHEKAWLDRSRLLTGDQLRTLEYLPDPTTGEPRWLVFSSLNKHATYATPRQCAPRGRAMCGMDDCADPAEPLVAHINDVLFPVYNAGEDAAPMLTSLDALGFRGETAWGTRPFCGGLKSKTCAAAVRGKLLADPFKR